MRSPKVSKKAKCHLDLDLALPLDQQHMLTSLAAGKNTELVKEIESFGNFPFSSRLSKTCRISSLKDNGSSEKSPWHRFKSNSGLIKQC